MRQRAKIKDWGFKVAGLRAKGKIPNSEWANIVRRHLGGESTENIARSYRCTGPAIRYIIRKSASHAAGAAPVGSDAMHGTAHAVSPRPDSRDAGDRHKAPLSRPSGLGRDLVLRANSDVASFIVALDEATTRLDAETIEDLRDATDRLLQSCARTRLEIERVFPASIAERH
jgi:hypothetical protein